MSWCKTHNSGFNWRNGEDQFGPRCDAYRLMSWPHPPQHESDCQVTEVPEWDEIRQLLWDAYTALRELHTCFGLDEAYPESANETQAWIGEYLFPAQCPACKLHNKQCYTAPGKASGWCSTRQQPWTQSELARTE